MTGELSHGYVLRVDKPVGPTSHDIVSIARRALGTRRVGHTGTLDPFASGLLLLCVNRATRLAEFLTGMDKQYQGVACLAAFTDTDDHTGSVLERYESWRSLDRQQIEAAMLRMTGPIDQVPPIYSAKKIDGERMYQKARRGEPVAAAPVRVTVSRFELLAIDLPSIEFQVSCSSGTYVRALARDLGRALGTGGHLSSLRRTRIGPFDVQDAVGAHELEASEARQRAVLSPLAAVQHLPRVDVDAEAAERLRLGKAIPAADAAEGATIVIASSGDLVALARVRDAMLRPFKVWNALDE